MIPVLTAPRREHPTLLHALAVYYDVRVRTSPALDEQEALQHSAFHAMMIHQLPGVLESLVEVETNRPEAARLLRLRTVARTARFLGDQGSEILRRGADRLFFK